MTPKPKSEDDGGQLSFESRLTAPPAARPPAPAAPVPPGPTAPVTPPAAPTLAPEPAPAPPRIYSVGELLRAVRLTLESRFAEVRVEGEISGLKRSGPGHVYFCLKDAEAQLDCVLFSREAARLRFRLEEGMAVRCRGRLTLYEARGKFQMTVADIEPTGAGALAVAFDQLKKKLGDEGLFETDRKRPLPFLPRRVGVVTSPTGAVIRDIIRVAHRRFPVPILLAPTPVQGEGASLAIASAIRRLQEVADVDVIIVARGGGSLEDLWAFNEEPVARAIFGCRVPVISAVGHETDFTISDFVADVRAPTPSAAAERALPVEDDLRAELGLLCRRAGRATAERVRGARHLLERAVTRLGDPRRLLDQRRQELDDQLERARRWMVRGLAEQRAGLSALEMRLGRAHPHRRIVEQRALMSSLGHRLEAAVHREVARRQHALEAARGKLEALSPLAVLQRGFSITQRADGHVITRASEVGPGERIRVRLRAGELRAEVEETRDEARDETRDETEAGTAPKPPRGEDP